MMSMVLALVLAASPAGWVPARWFSSDPQSLQLLEGTPVNCLLLQPEHWNEAFIGGARERKTVVLGVLGKPSEAPELARRGVEMKLDGFVLEGGFDAQAAAAVRRTGLPVIELLPRRALGKASGDAVAGTWQGVWPGINPETEDGAALAGPTSAPWLDTNSGFLRYLRSRTPAALWMANRPPEGTAFPLARYLQSLADAALGGARWVIALDRDLERRIEAGDPRALKEWKEIGEFARFLEERGEWRRWPSHGLVALAQEPGQGAFVSGGVLDMLAVQHLPVKPLEASSNAAGFRLTVDLTGRHKGSAGVVSSAPGWTFPVSSPDQFVIAKADLPKLEDLWLRVKEAAGRQNFGVRIFNAAGMLSHAVESPGGKRLTIAMVNYTGFPAEAITVHLLGRWQKARLLAPGRAPRELTVYPTKEGTGVEVDSVDVMVLLEVE